MSTAINKYPYFDLSEIVPDNDLSYKNYKVLKPVKAGNSVPEFTLSAELSAGNSFITAHQHMVMLSLNNY